MNFRYGRSDFVGNKVRPDMIVIHVGEGSQEVIYQTFCDTSDPKSSHYVVSKTGEIWQFVEEKDCAYTEGVVDRPISKIVQTRLQKYNSPNEYCIGIEHEGFGTIEFTPAQYLATAELVYQISTRWGILLDRDHIIPHREIRASKTCPGISSVEKIIALAKTFAPPPPIIPPSPAPVATPPAHIAQASTPSKSPWGSLVELLLAIFKK